MPTSSSSALNIRAERDRRIIQETAALLSADFPLEQLIERLCDSLSSALDASVTYVALPDSRHTVKLAYFLDHGKKKRPENFEIPRGSHTHKVFITGKSTLKRSLSDWVAQERHPLNPHDPRSDDSVSAIWVPIKYGDEVLGVLSVQAPQPECYDEDDVQLLEAVARYLAIAIRNQRTQRFSSKPLGAVSRSMIVSVAIGLLITLFLIFYLELKSQQMRSQEAAFLDSKAVHVADVLGRYLDDADQIARTASALLGPIRSNQAEVRRLLLALLASSTPKTIYGIGAWYEPFAFDSNVRLFGPYAHRIPAKHNAMLLTNEWMRASYNFPTQPWYRQGKNALGRTTFTEPYFDTDLVYMSAVHSFERNGRFAGVVTVDMVLPLLLDFVRSQNDGTRTVVYITTARGNVFVFPQEQRLLRDAQTDGLNPKTVLDIPASYARGEVNTLYGTRREEVTVPVALTNWQVHVSTDSRTIDASVGNLQNAIVAALLLLWMGIAGAIVMMYRHRHQTLRTVSLELAQMDLHSEIAERIEAEERLRERVYHDALTGLPNRSYLLRQLTSALAHSRQDDTYMFAVLFVDLDRFNVVNDSLGHEIGDRLLTALGRRLEARLHANDIVARLGGDEFVVLVQNLRSEEDAVVVADRLTSALTEPFYCDEHEIFMSASIGIAMGAGEYEMPEEILRDADIAMYQAKRSGRANTQVFNRAMHDRTVTQMRLETDLRRAVARQEFFLTYQPIVELSGRRVVGFEALVRWRHPTRGIIYPDDFIKLAEQTRLIVPLTAQVMQQAVTQIASWLREHPNLYVVVNISAVQLLQKGFLQDVESVIAGAAIPHSALRLELTESAIMENAEMAERVLSDLRTAGIRSLIDDFGTGYSSLSYLQRLPVDGLKIDRSFVAEMTQRQDSAEIVRAIVSLANSLNLRTVAEGIETPEQANALRVLGVGYGQGYYFGRPAEGLIAQALLEDPLAVD